MGIKGLTALISEHAPKAIRVRYFAWILSTYSDAPPNLVTYIGARHQALVRSQSRHRRVHVHLPISNRCPSKGRRNADERSGRDDEVRNASRPLLYTLTPPNLRPAVT
jgi:hypothetical protein